MDDLDLLLKFEYGGDKDRLDDLLPFFALNSDERPGEFVLATVEYFGHFREVTGSGDIDLGDLDLVDDLDRSGYFLSVEYELGLDLFVDEYWMVLEL